MVTRVPPTRAATPADAPPAPARPPAPPPAPPSKTSPPEAPGTSKTPAADRAPTPPARRRRFRRRPVLIGGGVLVVLLAGLVWVVVTGLLARGELTEARSEIRALQSSLTRGDVDPAAVDDRIDRIAGHFHRAHRLTTGPAWAVTAAVPWVGDPAQTTRGLTATADDLGATALPAVGRIAERVAGGSLRRGDSIDVDALTALAPDVRIAANRTAAAGRALAALPGGAWLPPVDRASAAVTDQVVELAAQLQSADTVVQVLPPLLGAATPQRYFVAFQNNAEARGTGGLPGAFAIVTATDGVVTFERFESDDTLLKPLVNVDGEVDFGADQAEYLAQYGLDTPFGDYRESNESPHFPYAAQIWAAMWQKVSGEQVTGAIALDPTALSYLLQATGPVQLPDGSELDADSIVSTTQKDVYARFPGLDNASVDKRKQYLLAVAASTEEALLDPKADIAELVAGASRAATERRLLVWSSDPDVEQVLAGTAVGGAIPESSQPFGMLTVINVAGTKLDYYLDRRLTWTRSGCGDTRDVTVAFTVTNTAPKQGLPEYVTYRADSPPAGTPVGSNRLVLDYLATSGALLQSATIDGDKAGVQTYDQRGHPVFRTLVEVPPGGSHTVVLHLREPAGTDPVTLITQPLIRPMAQTASDDDGCG